MAHSLVDSRCPGLLFRQLVHTPQLRRVHHGLRSEAPVLLNVQARHPGAQSPALGGALEASFVCRKYRLLAAQSARMSAGEQAAEWLPLCAEHPLSMGEGSLLSSTADDLQQGFPREQVASVRGAPAAEPMPVRPRRMLMYRG